MRTLIFIGSLFALSLAQTLVLTTPSYMASLGTVTLSDDYPTYACFTFEFVNKGNFNSTQWSMYIGANGLSKFTSLWDVENLQMNYVNPKLSSSYTYSISTNTYYNGEILKGDKIVLGACANKRTVGLPWSTIKFTGKALFVFSTDYPVFPYDYVAPTGTSFYEPFNDCLPTWPEIFQKFDVVVQGTAKSVASRYMGRVAVGGDVTWSGLWGIVDTNCTGCGDGNTQNVDDPSIVVGGQVNWNDGEICAGYVQGSATVVSEVLLNNVPYGCPTMSGTQVYDFTSDFATLSTEISGYMMKKPATGYTGYTTNDGNWLYLWALGQYSAKDVAVFNVPGNLLVSDGVRVGILQEQYLQNVKVIIINIGGSKVYLNYLTLAVFRKYQDKVIINCYEASEVDIASSIVYGTILAPKAQLVGKEGSYVHGSIFAGSLTSKDFEMIQNPWWGIDQGGNCIDCALGYWGNKCTQCTCKFNEDCSDGVDGTGKCTCKVGWNAACDDCLTDHWGFMCNNTCNATCMAHGHCSWGRDGNGTCSNCDINFTGSQCEKCLPGKYGSSCQYNCTKSCLAHGVCSEGPQGNGSCACNKGWAGAQCDVCDAGSYGASCQFSCVESCVINGKCSSGFNGTGVCLSCRDNFIGNNCELCKAEHHYGSNCQYNCSEICLERGSCLDGPFGSGLCTNCTGNYGGDQCDSCATGFFGATCESECSESCQLFGYCDSGINGTGCLLCLSGYELVGEECVKNAASGLTVSLLSVLAMLALFMF
jgi:choice-of-anchor A domain-containing protein